MQARGGEQTHRCESDSNLFLKKEELLLFFPSGDGEEGNSDQVNLIPLNQLFLLPAMERMWLIKLKKGFLQD